jgi:hypothetical protein
VNPYSFKIPLDLIRDLSQEAGAEATYRPELVRVDENGACLALFPTIPNGAATTHADLGAFARYYGFQLAAIEALARKAADA